MDTNQIIQNLKSERDYLLSQKYINRSQEKGLRNSIVTNLIKVITGPRRAGKSTLGINSLSIFEDFFYINFDSLEVLSVGNIFEFITQNQSLFKNGKTLFLDEIQNVPNFELLVTQLQRNGFNILMTGSNSNLLSKELATHLTGRYVLTEVYPFSFSEARQLIKNLTYIDYLKIGGFPEQLKTLGKVESYLSTLFESIILKDIIGRYSIRNSADLLKLATYLVQNPSQPSNFTRLTQKLGIRSVNTVIDFYGYLEEAYIVNKLQYFSHKSSEVIRSDFKTYLIDTGIYTANSIKLDENLGYLFENSIFNELLRMGHKPQINLFQIKNRSQKEIDFYLNEKSELIQVSTSVVDQSVREREFTALAETNLEVNKKIVIVLDSKEKRYSTDKVSVVGIEDWIDQNKIAK